MAGEIAWLMNAGVFIRKNPAIRVPFGTTPNEAAHARLKGAFWNVPQCTRAYVHRFCSAFTTRVLVTQRLSKQWSRSSAPSLTSDRAVAQMALELLAREPPVVSQRIGDSTLPKTTRQDPSLAKPQTTRTRKSSKPKTKQRKWYQPKRKYK